MQKASCLYPNAGRALRKPPTVASTMPLSWTRMAMSRNSPHLICLR